LVSFREVELQAYSKKNPTTYAGAFKKSRIEERILFLEDPHDFHNLIDFDNNEELMTSSIELTN
jgi:hypothetical protein